MGLVGWVARGETVHDFMPACYVIFQVLSRFPRISSAEILVKHRAERTMGNLQKERKSVA